MEVIECDLQIYWLVCTTNEHVYFTYPNLRLQFHLLRPVLLRVMDRPSRSIIWITPVLDNSVQRQNLSLNMQKRTPLHLDPLSLYGFSYHLFSATVFLEWCLQWRYILSLSSMTHWLDHTARFISAVLITRRTEYCHNRLSILNLNSLDNFFSSGRP